MARVCVFDANETLLNLGGLDPQFERVFGYPATRQGGSGNSSLSSLRSWSPKSTRRSAPSG